MAKLIGWNLVTVDGYFEGTKKWDLDFHNIALGSGARKAERGVRRQGGLAGLRPRHLRGHGLLLEDGRAGQYHHLHERPCRSSSPRARLKTVDWNNSRVTADIVPELKRLKEAEAKTLYVFGSADLTHSLLEAGLVDELMFCTVPVVLGQGTPFFKPGSRIGLELKESRPLASGSVLSTYRVQPAA